jgi:G3E family GTPase
LKIFTKETGSPLPLDASSMNRIPVTLITGFLGAGKTTLLNNLLTQSQHEKLAVIVNEFGEVGIDDKLLLRTDEEILEMNNGAICCAVRNDTVKVLTKLVENKSIKFDRVIIETTGLANPVPIARAFLDKPALEEKYRLDTIVTMVDASQILPQLSATPEAKTQIAAADVILLNKIDLSDERTIAVAKQRLRQINPIATIHETTKSDLSLELLRPENADQTFVREYTTEDHTHGHDDEVTSFVLTEHRPLDLEKVTHWIGEHIMLNSQNLLRYKGLLNIHGYDDRFVFQGVHEHFENKSERPWGNEDRTSQVVIIGKDLDKEAFKKSFATLFADV